MRAGAADLNFTLGLALISFVSFIAFGLRANGVRGYLKELLIAEPAYMTPLLTPIHLISELSRVISLSMRLFGNVFAGEVLLATMLALTTATVFILPLAFVIPGVFIGLELLFGLVQALVFALLSMTYITLAIAEHRQHGSDATIIRARRPSKAPPRRTGRRKEREAPPHPRSTRRKTTRGPTTLAAGLAMGLGGIGPGIGLGIGFSQGDGGDRPQPRGLRHHLRAVHPGPGPDRGDRDLCPRRLADHPLRQLGPQAAMAFFDAFGVDLFKLAFQIVNFLLILYLLNRFLFRRVLSLIDERQARIAKGLEDAEAAARDRELARAEREAALDEARKEAQAMIARATKIAEDSRAEIVAAARSEAEKVAARAAADITAEKERAIAELRSQVADLALQAAGKLVKADMNAATQRRLVDEFLAEVTPSDKERS